MKTYLGKKGLEKTWQTEFPENIKCHKCKGNCRIMFVAFEDSLEKTSVADLHDNTGAQVDGKGKYWPHDCIACAVYLCEKCLEPNAILNQA